MTSEQRKARWGSTVPVLVAWILLLFGADLYTILLGTQLPWFAVPQAAVLLAASGAFSFDSRLKPLRGFAIALAALDGGDFVRWMIESIFGGSPVQLCPPGARFPGQYSFRLYNEA